MFDIKLSVYGGVFKWLFTEKHGVEDYLKRTSAYRYDDRDDWQRWHMKSSKARYNSKYVEICPHIWVSEEVWKKYIEEGETSQYITVSINEDSPINWYREIHKKKLGHVRDKQRKRLYKVCQKMVQDLIDQKRLQLITPDYWDKPILDALTTYSIDEISVWDPMFFEYVAYWGTKISGFYD